jgi:hypothetical protein
MTTETRTTDCGWTKQGTKLHRARKNAQRAACGVWIEQVWEMPPEEMANTFQCKKCFPSPHPQT